VLSYVYWLFIQHINNTHSYNSKATVVAVIVVLSDCCGSIHISSSSKTGDCVVVVVVVAVAVAVTVKWQQKP
jgi:hypothetical protein